MKWSTDSLIGAGLVLTLMFSIFFGGGTELQTTLASGLIGYIGRSAIEHK